MKKSIKVLAAILCVAVVAGAGVALAACNPTVAEAVKVVDIELTSEDYAFCVNKSNAELLAGANEFLAGIKADGTLEEIINSYFNGNATFTYTNPASKDGCLVVATNAYFPPFEYFSGNKFAGVDMQIAKLLADHLGKPLYIDDMEFDSIIPSVQGSDQNHKADIGMAGLTVNATRLQQVSFTDSYYTSAQVIIVKEGDTTFDNCTAAEEVEAILAAKGKSYTVGTQRGTTGYMYSFGNEDYEYDGFANLTTGQYDTGVLAVKDLSNGKINAVIIDKQPAIMIAESINALIAPADSDSIE